MLSAVIPPERSQPAMPLAEQLAHQRFVRPGPLVLGTALVHLHSTPHCQPGSGNLWAPPLLIRRQPPQLNYPSDTVPDPDHGPRLDIQHDQTGISTTTPPELASRVHSLPAILHKPNRTPISNCSKGPGVFPSCCAKRASLLVVQFHRAYG